MGLKVFGFKKRISAINRVGQLKVKIAYLYCCTRSSTRCHLPSSSSPFDALSRRGSARDERKIRADRRLPRRRLQLRPQVRHTPPRRRTLHRSRAPSQLAIRPRGKERIESRGAVVTRANTRANPRERLPAHPKRTTNAPLTNSIPILRPCTRTTGRSRTRSGRGPSSR